jgi:hypothetical protein
MRGGVPWDSWDIAKAQGFHGCSISFEKEWEEELESLWKGDIIFAFSLEWESEWKSL